MNKENSLLSRYFLLCEYFGTLILASGISASFSFDKNDNQIFDVSILLIVLFIAIIIFYSQGDCDFNPGVTYLKYLSYTGKKKQLVGLFMIQYFFMQVLGAISGFLISFYLKDGFVVKLAVHDNIPQAKAFVVEILCSCVLYLVILIEDDGTNDAAESSFMRIFICIAGVAAGIAIGGNISGAGMNPAIGIGANFVRFLITGDLHELKFLWIYILGPFIASHLTSYFFINVYKNPKYYIQKNVLI